MIKIIAKNHKNLEPKKYLDVLIDIQSHIELSQMQALHAVNVALNMRNWIIGKIITEKQKEHAWGSDFIERISKDLQNMYPENRGFSTRNIYRIVAFYQYYQNIAAAAAILENLPFFRIPWFQNIVIMEKMKDDQQACLWYANMSTKQGWSRTYLEDQIKKNLYVRQGKAITNFTDKLQENNAIMAQDAFKDPYVFDFLKLADDHIERDLEIGLLAHTEELLLEMGKGFALVGRQYHIEAGDQDFYIDLLFYHFKLKCFVVVELKSREFSTQDAGQLNSYLSMVDDLVREENDGPTIGLLLCKSKNKVIVEYALRDINKPIGVAEYETELVTKLPKNLQGSLPSIDELEAEFEKSKQLYATKKRNKKS